MYSCPIYYVSPYMTNRDQSPLKKSYHISPKPVIGRTNYTCLPTNKARCIYLNFKSHLIELFSPVSGGTKLFMRPCINKFSGWASKPCSQVSSFASFVFFYWASWSQSSVGPHLFSSIGPQQNN